MITRSTVPVPVALLFAYDGGRFDGFARQPQKGLRTVEGELLRALREAGAIEDESSCGYRPGSRTDRGVSARRNLVAFRSLVPPDRLPGALVRRVEGLWPLSAVAVAPGFDPRRSKWREYRYFLSERELPDDSGPKDLARALSVFVGRHDFSAFARWESYRSPMREILSVDVRREGRLGREGLVVVRVRGRSFLWQQVRRILQAGLAVVRGEAAVDEVKAALARPEGPGPWGVAPASHLVLWEVHDPRVRFQVPERPLMRLRPVWAQDWGESAARLGLLEGLMGEQKQEQEQRPEPDP